nr:disease resistance protein [Tanacetum cinerariifolium]
MTMTRLKTRIEVWDHLGVQMLVAMLNATAVPAKAIVAFKVGTLDDISNLVDSMDGILHIGMGDFNALKSISERAVSQFDANEAMSFSNFIANVGFHDFNRVSKLTLSD